MKFLHIALFMTLIVSCGSDDNDSGGGNNNNIAIEDISEVAGLWDWTEDGDVYYLHISPEGMISDYDYYGDSVDMGDSCYRSYPNYASLSQIEGNTFNHRDEFYDEEEVVAISINDDGQLVVDSVTYGDNFATLNPTTLTPEDLIPECGDQSGVGTGGDNDNDDDGSGGNGSGNGNDDENGTAVQDISEVAGLWDWSEDGDEYYIHISPNGDLSDYDYQGDSFGMGDNCYDIYRDYGAISLVEGNTYDYADFTHDEEEVLEIFINEDGQLVLSSVTYGDYFAILNPVSLTTEDLIPECGEGEVAAKKARPQRVIR